MNIPNELEIINIMKTDCKKAHIAQCLSDASMHDEIKYDYFGQRVQRGKVLLHTKNGDFTLKFRAENGWLTYAEII